MKISVSCDSLLLKNSLEIFLKDHIVVYKNCDLVISDKDINTDKCLVVINSSEKADITVPFSKTSLLSDLKKIYNNRYKDHQINQDNSKKFKKLEKKFDKITMQYKEEIMQILREFCEK